MFSLMEQPDYTAITLSSFTPSPTNKNEDPLLINYCIPFLYMLLKPGRCVLLGDVYYTWFYGGTGL